METASWRTAASGESGAGGLCRYEPWEVIERIDGDHHLGVIALYVLPNPAVV
jgi:hypothetical protein